MQFYEVIKSNLSDILAESTAYGLPKIFKSKRLFLKLFWLVFFILGSIASIYFTIQSINNYLKYEVIPQISKISQDPMPFPTITFCPPNPALFENKSINDLFKFDSYGWKIYTNLDNYLERFSTLEYGDCFHFNSGRNMSGHSIPILKQIGQEKQYCVTISFNKLNISNNGPIKIWINDYSSLPFLNEQKLRSQDTSILNIIHEIQLTKTIETKLSLPYNPCYKEEEEEEESSGLKWNKTIINFMKLNNIKYNQKYCFKLCPLIETNNRCNCTKNNTSLSIDVYKDCYSNECYKKYVLDFEKIQTEKCKDYCPLECDSITYALTLVPRQDLNNKLNNSTLNYAHVDIFYRELKYTKFSEIPKIEVFSFISEIGGILGLFIGCSFVSLFEIAELLIEIFFSLISKNKPTDEHEITYSNNELKTEIINDLSNQFEIKVARLKFEILNDLKNKHYS